MIEYFDYSETDLNSHNIFLFKHHTLLSIVHCECNWGAITISAIKQWLYL